MISMLMLIVLFMVCALVLAVMKMPGSDVAMKLVYLCLAILFVLILIQVIFGVTVIPLTFSGIMLG